MVKGSEQTFFQTRIKMANRKDAWRRPPSRSRKTGAGRDPRAPVGGRHQDRTGSECARTCPALLRGRGCKAGQRRRETAKRVLGKLKAARAASHYPGLCPQVPAAREAARAWCCPLPEHLLPPRAPASSPLLLFSSCSSWNSVSRFSSLFQLCFLQESAEAPYTRRAPNTYFHE